MHCHTFLHTIQYLHAHDIIIADKRGRLNIALKELLRALKYAFVQSEIINANATPILNWCIFPAFPIHIAFATRPSGAY